MTLYRLPVMVRETGNYGVPGLIDLSGSHSIGLGGEVDGMVGFLLLRHKNGAPA